MFCFENTRMYLLETSFCLSILVQLLATWSAIKAELYVCETMCNWQKRQAADSDSTSFQKSQQQTDEQQLMNYKQLVIRYNNAKLAENSKSLFE